MTQQYVNKMYKEMLDRELDGRWQHIEEMHLTSKQSDIIKDIRQLELLRNYMETLCGQY